MLILLFPLYWSLLDGDRTSCRSEKFADPILENWSAICDVYRLFCGLFRSGPLAWRLLTHLLVVIDYFARTSAGMKQ